MVAVGSGVGIWLGTGIGFGVSHPERNLIREVASWVLRHLIGLDPTPFTD